MRLLRAACAMVKVDGENTLGPQAAATATVMMEAADATASGVKDFVPMSSALS